MAKFNPESIANIEVDADYLHNYAASWEQDGARFHVWFKPEDFKLAQCGWYAGGDGWIYKNPPLGTKTADVGYFHTRQLDPHKPRNVEILTHVFNVIRERGLVAAAEQAKLDKRAAEERANLESQRQSAIRAAGPAMLQLCREIVYGDGTSESHQKAIDLARALLAEVGETRDHGDVFDMGLPPGDKRVAAYRSEIAAVIKSNL